MLTPAPFYGLFHPLAGGWRAEQFIHRAGPEAARVQPNGSKPLHGIEQVRLNE